ncbi:MAG: RNA-binding protein [Planctomycetota bacterium]|nr:RNA-binding protein [Planctomycetota bacterium]
MTNIYVGNLAYDLTEAELQSAFERFGQVSSVSIVKDRDTGRSRGFGFVEMPDEQQAKQAIEGLNLEPIGSRRVTVNEARPREERPRGGGGGGGRDGGGRDGGGRDGGHRRSRGGW